MIRRDGPGRGCAGRRNGGGADEQQCRNSKIEPPSRDSGMTGVASAIIAGSA
jgi:hypothetical protein